MAASGHRPLSARSKRRDAGTADRSPHAPKPPAAPYAPVLSLVPDQPHRWGATDTADAWETGVSSNAEGPASEPPLTSEPPLADAAPLTSEPPLADATPLTSEPTAAGTAAGDPSVA